MNALDGNHTNNGVICVRTFNPKKRFQGLSRCNPDLVCASKIFNY